MKAKSLQLTNQVDDSRVKPTWRQNIPPSAEKVALTESSFPLSVWLALKRQEPSYGSIALKN